jgi:hypothetical protein
MDVSDRQDNLDDALHFLALAALTVHFIHVIGRGFLWLHRRSCRTAGNLLSECSWPSAHS